MMSVKEGTENQVGVSLNDKTSAAKKMRG